MFFANCISFMEQNKYGKLWIDSARNQTYINKNMESVDNFFVNITSNKNPDYLIVTNKEELNLLKKQNNYELVLSLPQL